MAAQDFNVLYVDDEEHNLISFAATFRKEYNVYTAKSASEGIDLMHKVNIHLVITDQRMPEMTGIQFLEKINPEFPDTIRIILTGFSDIGVIIEAINSGRVFRYITKPWDENDLRMTIENAKQLYELQHQLQVLLQGVHPESSRICFEFPGHKSVLYNLQLMKLHILYR